MTEHLEKPHIIVAGEAERAVEQDRITLHLRITETAEESQAAKARAAGHGATVLEALAGIPSRNLQASPVAVARREHDLRPREDRREPPRPDQVRVEFVATKMIDARYDIESGRAALRALASHSDIVTLAFTEFSISGARHKEVRRELLTEAVHNAREVADILAAAAEERIVGVLRIDEPRGGDRRAGASMLAASSTALANGPADDGVIDAEFEAGYATVSVRVTVTYGLD